MKEKIQSRDTYQRMASAGIRNEIVNGVGAYFCFLVEKGLSGWNSPEVRTINVINFEWVKGGCC